MQGPNQIGGKHETALEYGHHQQAVETRSGDLAGQRLNTLGNRRGGENSLNSRWRSIVHRTSPGSLSLSHGGRPRASEPLSRTREASVRHNPGRLIAIPPHGNKG